MGVLLLNMPQMDKSLKKIKEASTGLLYMSESDYPFELVQINGPVKTLQEELIRLSGYPINTPIEIITLKQFFRPIVTGYADSTQEQIQTARRFKELQKILLEELSEVQVYRIGSVRVEAFIIGKLKDGSYGGLRTTLIET